MTKKKEKSNTGTKHIVGGIALLLTALVVYLTGSSIANLVCPKDDFGFCPMDEGLLITALLLLFIAGAVISGIVLLIMGILRNTRTKQ